MPCSRATRTASERWRADPSEAELAAHRAAVAAQSRQLRAEARQVAQAYPDALQPAEVLRVYPETRWPNPS